MPKVIVDKLSRDESSLRLHNGGLLVYESKVFMVTSSPSSDGKYCTLINLSNGTKACTEPVSRNTSIYRVLRHLSGHGCFDSSKLLYFGEPEYKINISIEGVN